MISIRPIGWGIFVNAGGHCTSRWAQIFAVAPRKSYCELTPTVNIPPECLTVSNTEEAKYEPV